MEVYKTTNSNHTAAFFRLTDSMKRAKQNGRPFCLFLGAGCSLSSSIHPITTEQVIKDCLIRCMGPQYNPPSVWEHLYKDFVNHVWECYASQDRREILYECFKDLKPSIGYIKLKELVAHGYIKRIITTNFDMLIDDVLSDIPHITQVSNLPKRAIKGGSDIALFKVHGDIENGELRFSPRELTTLPSDISKTVSEFSRCSCLVCGYRGQDAGIMYSLDTSSEYSAFWATPKRPLESDLYENSQVHDWMNARKSSSNFIYGDILGTFDELMTQLCCTLIGDDSISAIPDYWDSSMIVSSLKTNQKVMDIFCNLLKCSNDLSEQYEWTPIYPFFAEDYKNVLNAYLFFYHQQSGENIPVPLQMPENEVESLLMGLAIEIVARTAGIAVTPLDYADSLRILFDSKGYHYSPDISFWNGLGIILESMQNQNVPLDWNAVKNIRLNMNNNGRFTVDIKQPMLHKIATVLDILNLCGLMFPTSANDGHDIEKDGKRVLEGKSHYLDMENGQIVLHFENMSLREYDHIYNLFLKNHRAILSGTAVISAPSMYEKETEPKLHTVSSAEDTLSEYIRAKSKEMTAAFLRQRTMFDFDNNQYVKTPIEDIIDGFIQSIKSGLFLIGSSGSGKTKSLQHFCEQKHEQLIVAATAPKCGYANGKYGADIFWGDLLASDGTDFDNMFKSIQNLLVLTNRYLVMIFDGLNEMSGGFNECIQQYKTLFAFMESIHRLGFTNLKIIVTCRDFAFLDYCKNSGIYPTPEFCFCETKSNTSVPYYQIQPLPIELQIKFAKSYIKNSTLCNRFITDLRNNRFIREMFTHPYMIAIAGKCYSNNLDGGVALISDVFGFFTRQMLHRLDQPRDIVRAQKVIDVYFSLLLSPLTPSRNITVFLLLSSDELFREQEDYLHIIQALQDINLFTTSEESDYIRISHDRIEEYLLSDYLYRMECAKDAVGQVLKFATIDSIYSCAIQTFFYRKVKDSCICDILSLLPQWYDVNPHIVPVAFVSSLASLNIQDYIDIAAKSTFEQKFGQEIMDILIQGLSQPLSYAQVEYPVQIFPALDVLVSTYPQLDAYRAYWNYAAAKYYMTVKNDYQEAIIYCDKAMLFSEKDSRIYHVIMLQQNMLRSKTENSADILEKFESLYTHFSERQEWVYAGECIVSWGAMLRRQTEFEKALQVYQCIPLERLNNSPLLRASIYRRIGTVYKNLMQRIVRRVKIEDGNISECELSQIKENYTAAISSFRLARTELGNSINAEALSLLSEMTETSIVVIPFMPEQRYFADVYLAEEEKLLSYIPIPEREVLFMRNRARLLELDGDYEGAVNTLVEAKSYIEGDPKSFRLFEIYYQLCRTVMRHWNDLPEDLHLIGGDAFSSALSFDLGNKNEYRKALLQAKDFFGNKLQQF